MLDTIHEPRVPPTCPALTTSHPSPTPALPSTSHYHTPSANTHTTQTTVHTSQSQQPPHPFCVKNGLRYKNFTVEWASYIEQFVEVQEELLIVGDFHIHVDSSNNESQSFLDILNPNRLIQHVKSCTHEKGHILDLVITREHSNLLKRPPVVFISGVSDVKSNSYLDHFAVLYYLNVNRPKTIHKSEKC